MSQRPVLILGGGVNGAATARELALNSVPVVLVDSADLAFGATAYSSRLIHGGLRYLEYGEFALVRESLEERARLLKLAPHLVHPLRLYIPVRHRWTGLASAAAKFVGLKAPPADRGLFLVNTGLWMYDTFARDPSLPKRSIHSIDEPGVPHISPSAGSWLAAYSDAQINFPERLVVEMLRDAQIAARQSGVPFEVLTYHSARLDGDRVVITPTDSSHTSAANPIEIQPAAIVNATGAWVDRTLARLPVGSRRLMGGTKGSHIFSWSESLRERLGGNAVYTEAADGRPVFLLPYLQGTLVGTTDIPFEGDPATAVASDQELEYLIDTVHRVFDDIRFDHSDIALHYCGVRPLPYVDAASTAAITRSHQLVWNHEAIVPIVSLVGGKLTTCRSLGEETAKAVLDRLKLPMPHNSRERPLPGATGEIDYRIFPAEDWKPNTVRDVIRDEWVTRLEDLVERRLMLLYDRALSVELLQQLAGELVAAGKLPADEVPTAIARCRERLQSHFGRQLTSPTSP